MLIAITSVNSKPIQQVQTSRNIYETPNFTERSRFEKISDDFEKMSNSANSIKSLTYITNTSKFKLA